MKEKIGRYKRNCDEIKALDASLEKLNEQLVDVEEVSGKVTKSSDDFPYTEQHVTVRMLNPKKAQPILNKIQEKEKKRRRLMKEVNEVDRFVNALPNGIEREILEMITIKGMKQREVARVLGKTKGRISQIVANSLQNASH